MRDAGDTNRRSSTESQADTGSVASIPHVVYAWPYVEWGGAQRYLFVIMRRLAGTSRVTVVMPEGSDPVLIAELETMGAAIRYFSPRLIVTGPKSFAGRVPTRWRAWRAQVQFWRACQDAMSPGAVLHCDVFPAQFTIPLALLAHQYPTVVTLHTALPRVGALRRVVWRARFAVLTTRPGFRVVAANDNVRRSLTPYMDARAIDAIPLAYSPVEFDEIQQVLDRRNSGAPVATTWQRDPGRFLVVTGAQFIERKGSRVLVEAARLVQRAAPDVDFVWIGPMNLPAQSAAIARSGGIRYLAQSDLCDGRRSYLAAVAMADIYVLPSLEEGLPLALVEAMALGVAVITTPVNAIPEAVTDAQHGLLVPPGDAERLAQAILRLHADADLRRRLATAGRERARMFDADRTVATTLDVYTAAINAMRVPHAAT